MFEIASEQCFQLFVGPESKGAGREPVTAPETTADLKRQLIFAQR